MAAETATTFMGSGVSGSHERSRFKFCISLSGVVSCKRVASSLVPRVGLTSSSSVFVFVCLRRSARWLVQRASVVCTIFYIEVLKATIA